VRILTTVQNYAKKSMPADSARICFSTKHIQIHLPALRERVDDIPVLAGEFLAELMQRYRRQIQGFHPDAVAALRAYPWPGNVRELRHVIERAVLLTRSNMVQASDLGVHSAPAKAPQLEQRYLDAAEIFLINRALTRHNGNALLAAKDLGLSRSAFYRRLQKHGITVP
jgi:DNA-binding NtrC family response regulator